MLRRFWPRSTTFSSNDRISVPSRSQPGQLQASLAPAHTRTTGASTLTAAELRLLPLLATHLSYRQIGEQLFLSANTVKTEAYSAFRKLGVSSRNEAVVRTRELGLGAL